MNIVNVEAYPKIKKKKNFGRGKNCVHNKVDLISCVLDKIQVKKTISGLRVEVYKLMKI